MYRDVFIGYFTDGYDHIGDPYLGNSPTRISPFFPGFSTPYFTLISRIKDGIYTGRKVDWDAWAAEMTKQQIVDFIQETYGRNPFTGPYDDHLRKNYGELIAFVSPIDPEEKHYLVASSI